MTRWFPGMLMATLACVTSRGALAQRPHTDTLLVRAVLEGTLSGAAPELAEFVVQPRPEFWRLTPPDSTDPLWRSAFRGLRELLHATSLNRSVDSERYLELHEGRGTDTVRVFTVYIGMRWRCRNRPDRWVSGGRSFELRVARSYGVWHLLPATPWIDEIPGVCEP